MRGVEIWSGASREFIPHAEVVQIGAAKDLVVSMSQLTLVRRHARLGRIVSTSRILYIRGEREQRDAHVRGARRWLEDRRRTTAA